MPLEGVRILLVTRDRPIHDRIRTLCGQISPTYHGLEWAGGYRAALAALEAAGPDVCILDEGLLNGSGLDLLREPSLSDRRVPVVLLLDDLPLPDEDPLARPGVADWIVKDALDVPSLQRALRHARLGRRAAVARSESRRSRDELLLHLADAIGRARRLEDALRSAVEEMVHHLPWDVGHVCLRDDAHVRSTPIWYPEDSPRHAELRRVTAQTRFARGQGLVGQAFAAGRPVWKSDVATDPDFLRRESGGEVRAALAVPVLAGDEVVAVLEFFSSEAREPDPRILETAERVCRLLSPIADRERIVETLQRRERELRADRADLEGRIRVLEALLGVGTALREPGLPLPERLERIAGLVCAEGVLADRPGEARIVLHDKEFRTQGFDASVSLHRVPIRSGDGDVGVLEVASSGEGAGDATGDPARMADLLDRIARELGTVPVATDDKPN